MTIVEKVQKFVDKQAIGQIFTYRDIDSDDWQNVTNELNSLKYDHQLAKVKRGYFYKVDHNKPCSPCMHEILSAYVDWNTSYYTGLCAYAKLNLVDSAHIKKKPKIPITIATLNKPNKKITINLDVSKYKLIDDKYTFKHKIMRVKYQLQSRKIDTQKVDTYLALLLDAIKDLAMLKMYNNDIYSKIKTLISELNESQKNTLIAYASGYEPSTRAQLGSIFDLIGNSVSAQKIHATLNKMSEYTVDFDFCSKTYKFDWRFKRRTKRLKIQSNQNLL